MYPSSPLSLSAWVLAILALALDSHTVSALPVPAAAANSVVLSPVQRSLPAPTAPFLESRKVRRSTTPLHLVDSDDDDHLQTLVAADMRDPRNWLEAASSSSSTAAAPVVALLKRDRVPSSMPISDSIFSDFFSGPDSDDASSLEPNGIHASLAAAMAVRQIEQRQTPPPPQIWFAATHRPASAKAGPTAEADVQVPTLPPASESRRSIDSVNRMNPPAAAAAAVA